MYASFRGGSAVCRVAFAQLGTRAAVYAVPDPDGPSTYNHAIGLGFGKHKKLQQLWLKQEAAIGLKQSMPSLPFISSSCEVGLGNLAALIAYMKCYS